MMIVVIIRDIGIALNRFRLKTSIALLGLNRKSFLTHYFWWLVPCMFSTSAVLGLCSLASLLVHRDGVGREKRLEMRIT